MIMRSIAAVCLTGGCLMAAPVSASTAINSADLCQQSFQLKISTKTEFSFKGTQITRHKFKSFLSTKKLNVTEKGQWWGMQLTEVEQQANGQAVPNDPVYNLPFGVLRSANGELLDYRFPAKVSQDQQNILKGLTQYFQFPHHLEKAVVRRMETDVNGKLEAKYSRVSAATAGQSEEGTLPSFTKQKLRYLNLPENGEQALSSLTVEDASQTIVPSNCWVDNTRGRETLLATGLTKAFEMLTTQTYSVRKAPQPADSLLWQLSDNINDWVLKEVSRELSAEEKAALSARFKQMLKQLDITAYSGTDLSEWLLQFDEVLADLQPMLLENQFDDAQQKRLFNALGILDSANGNALLVALINQPELDETNRFRAMRAISNGTSALTPALSEKLHAILQNEEFIGTEALQGAALMTLGAILQRRENNEYADALLLAMSEKLTPDLPAAKRAALIASLGNAASDTVLDEVASYAGDSEQRVRANVARSLGQIGGEQAYQTLGNMLQTESGQKAQQAILGAIAQFELDANELQKVSQLAKSSQSERTRGLAISALAEQTHMKTLVQTQLRSIMKTESSRSNFKKAAKALVDLDKSNSDG